MDFVSGVAPTEFTNHPELGTLEKQGAHYVAANGDRYERSVEGQFTLVKDESEPQMASGWYDPELAD